MTFDFAVQWLSDHRSSTPWYRTMNMIYGQIYIAQDIQSKMLLLLPIDIEDCAHISLLYQTPGRELYHQMPLMTSCIITGMYLSF